MKIMKVNLGINYSNEDASKLRNIKEYYKNNIKFRNLLIDIKRKTNDKLNQNDIENGNSS